jgi:hypothetical protein
MEIVREKLERPPLQLMLRSQSMLSGPPLGICTALRYFRDEDQAEAGQLQVHLRTMNNQSHLPVFSLLVVCLTPPHRLKDNTLTEPKGI